MIGKIPNAAPAAALLNACPAGIPYTAIATVIATASAIRLAR